VFKASARQTDRNRVRAVVRTRTGVFKSAKSVPASDAGPAAVCLVRQPLFNGDEELVGQRLLCSTSAGSQGGYLASIPRGADGELVLAEDLHAIAPRRLIFLSVSRSELIEGRALSLAHDRVVLSVRADASLDDDLRDALDRHAMRGFQLVLDAVELARVEDPLLERAQTVLIDIGAHPRERLEELVDSVRWRVGSAGLVAVGVDSRTAFQTCRRLGFDVFEGQFFLRATPGPTRTIARSGLGGMGTLADLAATDNFERLAETITRDPGLSMRLLRYANSAHAALPRRVGSVHEALAWLGTVAVREFALIAAMAEVPEAPPAMLVTALTRARMCQALSRRLPATNPEESFTVGLFSVAEAVTNAPLETVLGELPVREDIALALGHGAGDVGRLLAAVLAYERGDFAPATTLGGTAELTGRTYLESIRWADSAVKSVG
jgi:EAL and modified HD-GYP domain-containing signal transduction protein